ncbi:MAG: nucleoside-triphosphatase [Pseudomonadota bacterium]
MKRIIITGNIHSGKTTLAETLVTALTRSGIRAAGILARGLWKNNLREGFDLVNLTSGTVTPLARRSEGTETGTPYLFFQAGIDEGFRALSMDLCRTAGIILIDEIGPLELRGLGWAPCLTPLLTLKDTLHIWVVRDRLLDQVMKTWPVDINHRVLAHEPNALETLMTLCLE